MRRNIYREKILKLLRSNHLLSILEIHKKIIGADYSTVYRNIEKLLKSREIKKVVLDKDVVVYEFNDGKNKHDHFLCLDCGTVEVVHVVSEKIVPVDYKITDVIVRGLCTNCH